MVVSKNHSNIVNSTNYVFHEFSSDDAEEWEISTLKHIFAKN